jgi:hypothetical protein
MIGPIALTPAQRRTFGEIMARLNTMIRYDDESLVNAVWIRQRYDCGCYPTFGPARRAAVRTAWHEAGHAVAALAIGATFSSASIHHARKSEGRVHRITATTDNGFIVDAAGQIAERLMNWSMLETEDELARWLPTWRGDGGDARRFRGNIRPRFGTDEAGAWRHSETMLVPLRPRIRNLARGLLVHHTHLPYPVVAALADSIGSSRRP